MATSQTPPPVANPAWTSASGSSDPAEPALAADPRVTADQGPSAAPNGLRGPEVTLAAPSTAPAITPPRWSGKKTAVAAALAIGLSSAGAVAAAATVQQGTGGTVDGRGGFGRQGGFLGQGQFPGQGRFPGQGQFPGQGGPGQGQLGTGSQQGQGLSQGQTQGSLPQGPGAQQALPGLTPTDPTAAYGTAAST